MSYDRGTEQQKSPSAGLAPAEFAPSGEAMIDLHYAPTPNGWKISIMLEELGLPYKVIPVNIRGGDQFKPEFLAISPNNRIPVIVDHSPADGGEPFSVFETGAILIYLAEKTGRFLAQDMRGRSKVVQWVMWQMSGLGPMLGQHGHFALYAAEKIPYAIERYRDEAARLYGVLDRQLGKDRRLCRRLRLFDPRHRLLPLDHDPQGAGLYARRLPQRQTLVRIGPRPAAGAGGARDR
jgi:glutathione S-transferase